MYGIVLIGVNVWHCIDRCKCVIVLIGVNVALY